MPGRIRRHWKRWLIAGVATVAVLTTAGPYLYINYIQDEPPAALSLDSPPSASDTSSGDSSGSGEQASGSVEGAWRVGSGSQAG